MVNYHVQKVQRECVVWSVVFLASSTIVTSDSFGRVQFWDWQRGTLVESHTVSTSSALSLAVSEVSKSPEPPSPPRQLGAHLGCSVQGQRHSGRSRAGGTADGLSCLPVLPLPSS